jgi:hypothetical protein
MMNDINDWNSRDFDSFASWNSNSWNFNSRDFNSRSVIIGTSFVPLPEHTTLRELELNYNLKCVANRFDLYIAMQGSICLDYCLSQYAQMYVLCKTEALNGFSIPELVNSYNNCDNEKVRSLMISKLGSRKNEFEVQQHWVGCRDIIMCISRMYKWSLINQIETDRLRTWPGPDELSELGRFICHCWFDVAGGEPDNGVGRLIMEFAC